MTNLKYLINKVCAHFSGLNLTSKANLKKGQLLVLVSKPLYLIISHLF